MKKYTFCNGNLISKVEKICKSIIQDNELNIKKIYNIWQNEFDAKNDLKNTYLGLSIDKINKNLNVPKNLYNYGIDFPIWFNNLEMGRKKIMVIGRDPTTQ